MGQFWAYLMVRKVPSYKFSLKARIEGAVITIMYHITYSNKIVLLSQRNSTIIGYRNEIALLLQRNSTIIATKYLVLFHIATKVASQ